MSLSILLILCIAKESVTRYTKTMLDVWLWSNMVQVYIYKTRFSTSSLSQRLMRREGIIQWSNIL